MPPSPTHPKTFSLPNTAWSQMILSVCPFLVAICQFTLSSDELSSPSTHYRNHIGAIITCLHIRPTTFGIYNQFYTVPWFFFYYYCKLTSDHNYHNYSSIDTNALTRNPCTRIQWHYNINVATILLLLMLHVLLCSSVHLYPVIFIPILLQHT